MDYVVPIYLINGFLDSGKTTFIQETIEEDNYQGDGDILLIVCEEGDVEYDESVLDDFSVRRVVISKAELTAKKLKELDDLYTPFNVIVEYNGMWERALFDSLTLPKRWFLNQAITLVDASSFEAACKNMKPLVAEVLKGAELVVFNRCIKEQPLASFRTAVKAINQNVQVIFEDMSGQIVSIPPEIPYNLSLDTIVIENKDYGIFHIDAKERPELYNNKRVVFEAQVMKNEAFARNFFVAGRVAMNCCEKDTIFIGYLCKSRFCAKLSNAQWIRVTAVIKYENRQEYGRVGPVLYAENIDVLENHDNEIVGY